MDWLVEEWNARFLFIHLDLEERFVIYLCATYELSVWRWLPVSFWSLRSCRHVTLEIYYNFSCLYCAMHVSTSSRERERLFVSLFWNYTTTRTRPRPTACLGTCLLLNRRWTLSLSLNDVLAAFHSIYNELYNQREMRFQPWGRRWLNCLFRWSKNKI